LRTLEGNTHPVRTLAISHFDNRLLSGAEDGSINVWHLTSGRLLSTLVNSGSLRSIALFSKSRQLISSGREGSISVWNWMAGDLRKTFDGHNGLTSCVMSINNLGKELIVSASRDRTIKVWSPNGTLLYSFEGHSKGINSISPIPSSLPDQQENTKQIISASEDGTL
jgi:WD40 repeat protein